MSFGVIIVGRWPNPVFREREIGNSASCDRLSARSLPPSRCEGFLSRLGSHTLRTLLAEKSTHLRMLRGFTRGPSYHPALGLDPTGVHLLDLLPVTLSYEAVESYKTSVWSLALMSPSINLPA